MSGILNPATHETIAKQLDAEADDHEKRARECRREAQLERDMAKYIKIFDQIKKP